MQITITKEQRNEIVEIHSTVAKQALRLRNLHQQDEVRAGHALHEASSLLHAAEQKLLNFLDPEHAGEIEWERKSGKA
jgi:hypothetical protein